VLGCERLGELNQKGKEMDSRNKLISLISKIISKDDFSASRLECLKDNLVLHLELNEKEIVNISDLINSVNNDRMNQEFLAAIFLRLYKNHENLIEDDSTIKHKIVSLFDTVYLHIILKKLRIQWIN
jgi:hypothetical protein